MRISHSKKYIFIHNYKVAGVSISTALHEFNEQINPHTIIERIAVKLGLVNWVPEQPMHIKARELKEALPTRIYNKYYKFGFVRDPWDWQVSLYNYMLKREDHHQHSLIKNMKDFDEYIDWRVNNDVKLQKDFFFDK